MHANDRTIGNCSSWRRSSWRRSSWNCSSLWSGGTWSGKLRSCIRAAGVVAALVAGHGCSSSSDPYYYDPYGYYDYYYPASYAYVDPYYSDYWYGYPTYVLSVRLKASLNNVLPATALRDLALGEGICPGQVTVTTERATAPCDIGGGGSVPVSTSIHFDGCRLSAGGQLDGSLSVEAAQKLSDSNCDAGTSIDVSYTSTTRNLVYTAPNGSRIELPQLTRTGSYTRSLGLPPTTLRVSSEGRIERYDEKGTALAKTNFTGAQMLTLLPEDGGFRVDGTLMLNDSVSERSSVGNSAGLTRTDGCCYPTAGSIDVARSDGEDESWSFGPSCGDISVNGHRVTPKECF
jgi:hypothetical protein